jgi:CRISPR-associated endonuclease Csy4
MNHYLDITLLPDADIGLHFLWEKVYRQIHLGLVEIQDDNGSVPVGVAFPAYDAQQRLLGNKLRLLANSEALLERFNAAQWLSRLSDYVHLTGIRRVPEGIRAYACYARIQPKSSKTRLARRKARREHIDYEQALAALENFSERRADAPYVWMNSQTNGERFCLFIGYTEKTELIQTGFSAYGLSRESSVPVF